jgi:hypothetical protein
MAIIDVDRVAAVIEKFKQLRPLVESVYPGYTLLIASKESDLINDLFPSPHPTIGDGGGGSFQSLSGVKQIEQIMEEAGQPISKKALWKELQHRGSDITKETLTSYLSRFFASHSRGIWKLRKEKGGT